MGKGKRIKTTNMLMSIYGINTPAPDPYERERQARRFEYLMARIKAKRLNPKVDYDNERGIKLLEEIAISDTSHWQREKLVKALNLSNEEYEE